MTLPANISGLGGSPGNTVGRHGWLLIDKDKGWTSAQVIRRVRSLLRVRKAGHAGTLDPIATGLLPVALGEATKTIPFLVEGIKTYEFVVKWGEARDTDDAEGTVIRRSEVRPEEAEIRCALVAFHGEISQRPPDYSAIKVSGRRAYQLAREKQPVALAERQVTVKELKLLKVLNSDSAAFRLRCGKGVYVRSIARDLGKVLGTEGYVVELRRLGVGTFDLEAAISLAQVEELKDSKDLAGRLLPLVEGLPGVPVFCVDPDEASRLRQGQAVVLTTAPSSDGVRIKAPAVMCAILADRPVALVDFAKGEIRPRRVFNYAV
ncbi:MAG: tRNA pseudouridine(55) synthase TruB [Pseudomonadota bacterium]|nr:tRNA pseudouridine(55) synthase TruB [Pseudomonadota bacterium]